METAPRHQVIRNGRLLDPEGETVAPADILIDGEDIAEVAPIHADKVDGPVDAVGVRRHCSKRSGGLMPSPSKTSSRPRYSFARPRPYSMTQPTPDLRTWFVSEVVWTSCMP